MKYWALGWAFRLTLMPTLASMETAAWQILLVVDVAVVGAVHADFKALGIAGFGQELLGLLGIIGVALDFLAVGGEQKRGN